ncbi:MAG: hypothetical protein ACI4RH_03565 [Huintestinicola sp.]
MSKEDRIYLLVADDPYQLPLCTGDSLKDLARETGISYKTLQKSLHKQLSIRLPKGRFTAERGLVVRVDLKEE